MAENVLEAILKP